MEVEQSGELVSLRQKLQINETQLKEFRSLEENLRAENRKLQNSNEVLNQQMKKISDREIENRVRAEVSEELVEKFFDKMLERMN